YSRPLHTSLLFPYTTLFRSIFKLKGCDIMKERIFSRKFWQKVFNYQLIIWFLLMISYTFSQRNNHFYFIGDLFNLAFSTAIMGLDRKSTRLNSSHVSISYAV